jgi:hypothetical protein
VQGEVCTWPRNRCPSGWPRRFFPFLVDSAAAWLLGFSDILPTIHNWSQMRCCGYPSDVAQTLALNSISRTPSHSDNLSTRVYSRSQLN